MKKTLGLDIGTNSIGWAIINESTDGNKYIEGIGSRIIPMSQDIMDKFGRGQTESSTAERTVYRGVRRIRERSLLRRERLHRILHLLKFLPKHYDSSIGWDKNDNRTYGKFLPGTEVKLSWVPTDNGNHFLFMDSYLEMISDLQDSQPHLFKKSNTPVPMDWTIYYLRKKALTKPISAYELSWIILNFNQKRGYYQLRGEEQENDPKKREEYYALRVDDVEVDSDSSGLSRPWYNVKLENGWIYRCQSNKPLDNWIGIVKDFIITTHLDDQGETALDKDGDVRRNFRAPSEDDWTLLKKKTESDLQQSGKSVGAYIYDTLLNKPTQKVRGELIRTIERLFYRQELSQILDKQMEFIPELTDQKLFSDSVNELYPRNENHRNNLLTKDFKYLFINDILFYQRPLKTKKSLIANCSYEYRTYRKDGKLIYSPIKCIAKSNPYFQEFRLWQFIDNLRILQRQKEIAGIIKYNVDVTSEYLPNEDALVELFNWLNERKEIKEEQLLRGFFNLKKDKTTKEYPVSWNYVKDRQYPCNETGYLLRKGLIQSGDEAWLNNKENEYHLWHLLYSVEDPLELKGALTKLAKKESMSEDFVSIFVKLPPFKKDYGSYSEKAIKRLLPLMRRGKLWSEKEIDRKTINRIQQIIDGEVNESIDIRTREKLVSLREITSYKGLPLWLAGYVVYDRHSEANEIKRWKTPEELDHYIKHEFKQYSLRNPIVEQVILEMLRLVKDLWSRYGDIDEIHLEIGRDLKSPAQVREKYTKANVEKENEWVEVQEKMLEFHKEGLISNPYSPSQKMKYKLWLEQKHISPYTGKTIPLTKLFTSNYEIEHIIPQSRYFDDSYSNKVVCESEVNKLKGSMLGYEFIRAKAGETVLIDNIGITILSSSEYVALVDKMFGNLNQYKASKLLVEDIEDLTKGFSERQLNDTRYISRYAMGILSGLVRDDEEKEAISKNIITCSGKVTDVLKRSWGLNDIWDSLIQPRFERLNEMTVSEDFGKWISTNDFQIRVPDYLQRNFSKKRIDHRHHALDALVIACATRNHTNYINNVAAWKFEDYKKIRYDLKKLLIDQQNTERDTFLKPWSSFAIDAKEALQQIVVSHKKNLRVLTDTVNKTEYIDESGKKQFKKQDSKNHYAVRKPLHQETIYGRVSIRLTKQILFSKAIENWRLITDKHLKNKIRELILEYGGNFDAKTINRYFKDRGYMFDGVDIKKVEVYHYDHNCAATRKPLNETFTEKQIEKITDESIRKILHNHIDKYKGDIKEALSVEGLADMNNNITQLNGGVQHHPIYKVRLYEDLGSKFSLGTTHNNPKKFAVAAKGTNLYFGIYVDDEGKRSFESIPFNVVLERLKNGLEPVPEELAGSSLLFYLSPNDVVYVPTEEEQKNRTPINIDTLTKKQYLQLYKMVSCTGRECHFLPVTLSKVILDKKEFGSLNKLERDIDGNMIKQICWKLTVNRIGEITDVKN